MKIEILGSGGSVVTPRPGCFCSSCTNARLVGSPYIRTGPSIFFHDYKLVVDTPEDIAVQLNRSGITQVDHCLYSHWHGDHVLGRRIFYTLNYDFSEKRSHRVSKIYLSAQHLVDFEKHLGHLDHFKKLEEEKLIELVEYNMGMFKVGNLSVVPFHLQDPSIFGFEMLAEGKRAIIVMDDTFNWKPSQHLIGADLVFLPIGIFRTHPITGVSLIPDSHHLLKDEATFEDTVRIIQFLKPKKTVLIHIEEHDHIGFDSFSTIERKFRITNNDVICAVDGMVLNV